MAFKAPGKHFREGVSLPQLMKMFPDDEKAREWFEGRIWPNGPVCPHCGTDNVQSGIRHRTMTHRCRECVGRPMFSLKTGNIMEGSKLGYRTWAIAIHLTTTGLKGVSSMRLHRDLDITQKSAWHLAMRLRKAFDNAGGKVKFAEAEIDGTYIGGLERNRHASKKLRAGRGGVGKWIVAVVKDRKTGKPVAQVVPDTKSRTLQEFVKKHTTDKATVYTDEHSAYVGLDDPNGRTHEAVCHRVGEYVREQAHTNGVEAFWAAVERGHKGVFHKFSRKHLQRYVDEFAGKRNARDRDTIDQMYGIAASMIGKRLRYDDLIADNGLESGARG